jgi:hypothetical protein
MATALAALRLALMLASQVTTGSATYYADGVFETVAANRGMQLPAACPECVGYVSLLDCDDIGQHVWVSNGAELVGPLLNVDCAAEHHRGALVERGWVADLPYWLAQRWQMAGPITVTILAYPSR